MLILKYQKLIKECEHDKEYYLRQWVDKKALNCYDINIRLYTEFITDLEELQKEYDELDFDRQELYETKGILTRYKKFINRMTGAFRKTHWAEPRLKLFGDVINKAMELKNNDELWNKN